MTPEEIEALTNARVLRLTKMFNKIYEDYEPSEYPEIEEILGAIYMEGYTAGTEDLANDIAKVDALVQGGMDYASAMKEVFDDQI